MHAVLQHQAMLVESLAPFSLKVRHTFLKELIQLL
jgi:hypothetical protein